MSENITTVLDKPELAELLGTDVIYVIRGTGSNRDGRATLSTLSAFLATGGMDEMTLQTLHIGENGDIKVVQGTGPTIGGFAAIEAGVVEASTKFQVGSSEWTPGNSQPTITGLYGLNAGNVGTTNLQADTIGTNGENLTSLQVKTKLVGDQSAQDKSLKLGAVNADSAFVSGDASVGGDLGVTGDTSVGGDLDVTGDATVTGSVTADGGFGTTNGDIATTNGDLEIGGRVKYGNGTILVASSAGDETTITTTLNGRSNGSFALIVNKMSTALQFNDALYAKTTFQVPGYTAVQVVKVDGKVYPVGGDYV